MTKYLTLLWHDAKALARNWALWLVAFLAPALAGGVVYLSSHAPSPPEPEPVYPYVPGWIPNPPAVRAVLEDLRREQGFATWGEVFRDDSPSGDDDGPRFFWAAEEKVLGSVQQSWDQKNIGSCVSFGWGRACNDLVLIQVANGEDEYPGHPVATEPIYGGSRVEVGGGRVGGDGSVGAWAAQWVNKWGLLFRQKYLNDKYDLTSYDVSRCRSYGNKGCPDDLEPIAREHPVRSVAQVKSAAEAWQALGSGYPVAVCSNYGFQSPLKEGYCKRSGSWAHCMCFRGRFVHPERGKSFVVQNSWGNYLASGDPYISVKGKAEKMTLPEGCFAITEKDADGMCRQGDTFAASAFKGFPKRKLDWLIRHTDGGLYATVRVRDDRHAVRADAGVLLLR